VNLYVKNLDDSVDSEELRRNFEQHGAIASAKVMLDDNGRSKGFGFVCFERPDDATKAVVEMNNRMLSGKPLYVALAQRKEDRKAQLASQYMQRMASMRMQNAAGMPVYAPTNAGFYVQGTIPNQRGPFVSNNLPAQMRPGNVTRWNGLGNPGYGAMRGYMVQPNQFGHRGGPRQQTGARPQQHYQTGNRPQNRPAGVPAVAGQPAAIRQQQQQIGSQLSSVSPQEQKQILGEHLYPRILQLCKEELVGKITGMMLEMDNSELLMMLENPELLQDRVHEAANVLQSAPKPAPVNS